MKRFLRWLIQTDAHTAVGIFALICALVGTLASLQQDDEASNQRWANDNGTKYAAKE